MNKIITFQQINPFKKAYNALSIATKQRFLHSKQLYSIAHKQVLQDPVISLDFNDSFSYSYRLFNCTQASSIHLFHPYSDQQFGGDSKAELYFDLQQQSLTLSGKIECKNKDKLEQHPSIGIARRNPYRIKCGPFNAIQFQIDSDGQPMHLGVQLQSQIEGVLSCYGIVTSRIKGLCTFQLPFQNMLVSGAEYGNRGSQGYQTPKGSQLFFDRQAYDAKRVLTTQNSQAIIRDINIRLLETKTIERKIGLKNINLVRRAYSRKFLQDYLQPYFYLVDQDPYIINEELGISWLAKGYNQFKTINLGDKIYRQKESSNRYNK